MQAWEVLLLAVALSMDACTVAMTNGMTHPKMPVKNALFIGLFFGFFQFLMPVVGYYITGIVTGAFMDAFELVSAWISFGLLAFLGGRMLYEGVKECMECRKNGGKKRFKKALKTRKRRGYVIVHIPKSR